MARGRAASVRGLDPRALAHGGPPLGPPARDDRADLLRRARPALPPPQIYAPNDRGQDDGLWRFSLFVRAAIEALKRLGRRPRILHAHDWHPALAAMLGAWSNWRDRWFDDVASVLTIHNLGYQGVYGREEFPILGLPDEAWTGGAVEFGGNVNLLKGAIVAADMITAVSPTYANEIRTPEGGVGLDAILRRARRPRRRDPERGRHGGLEPGARPAPSRALRARGPPREGGVPRGALPARGLRAGRPRR